MHISLVLIERTIPGFTSIADEIRKIFSARITTATIDFPLTKSFRKSRGQFDADVMLKELMRPSPEADRTVFLFREDLFAQDLAFVFGAASSSACIVSTTRLDPRFYGEEDMGLARSLFMERLLKEIVHELGHSLGLPHCQESSCVMVFSNSIEDVDKKGKHFCDGCRKALYLDK